MGGRCVTTDGGWCGVPHLLGESKGLWKVTPQPLRESPRRAYGTPGPANGGQADYEQRFAEFTAPTMMLNLPSSPECFRYALGKYYFRLAGPLQTLHELLCAAGTQKWNTEALALSDLTCR